jgi:hypothetical protein
MYFQSSLPSAARFYEPLFQSNFFFPSRRIIFLKILRHWLDDGSSADIAVATALSASFVAVYNAAYIYI